MKAGLAANVLYVVPLALSKLSFLLLLSKLSPSKRHKTVIRGIGVLVTLFTVLFRSLWSPLPVSAYDMELRLWQTIWWIVFDTYNIITESTLIAMPIYLISKVQWPICRKVTFSTPFALRTCTIAACIADMMLWQKVSTSTDPYFAEWTVSVTTQVIQSSCLVCTCFLYLRNFLESIETGFGLDGNLSASIPLKSRSTAAYNLSSERLADSASMPGRIKVTSAYEVRKECPESGRN